jgi:hypothetical protein
MWSTPPLRSALSFSLLPSQRHVSGSRVSREAWQQASEKPKEAQSNGISVPHLKALVERFGTLNSTIHGGHYPKVRPLVSIEQFFKGSNGRASMWSNQFPGVDKSVDELGFWRSLRDRKDVWDVHFLLSQYDFNDVAFKPDGEWVHSDVVVIISSAPPEELIKSFPESAKPEFITDAWKYPQPHERVFVPSGMKPLFFWYD